MSRYLISTARGDSPYYAVPVFLSRVFRHNSIYIRNDRGINPIKGFRQCECIRR